MKGCLVMVASRHAAPCGFLEQRPLLMSLRLVGPSESLDERYLRVRPLRPSGPLPAMALMAALRPAGAGGPCDGPASLKSRWLCPFVGLASSDSEAVNSQLAQGQSALPRCPGHSLGQFKDPVVCLFVLVGLCFTDHLGSFLLFLSLPPRSHSLHCGSLLQWEIREEIKQSSLAPSPWLWIHFGWWEEVGSPGGGSDGKEYTCQCRRHGFDPWVRKIPWRREWLPTPVSLPGESHGQRSLVGYSPGVAQSRIRLND